MKKLLLITLLFSVFANAQPNINNPTPFIVCDVDNNGSELYFYSRKTYEILNGLDFLSYTIKNYHSLSDSQQNINADTNQQIGISANKTIYIRVFENANPSNYVLTTLELIFSPAVIANSVTYIAQPDIPFDGHSTFDLTTKSAAILGNQINSSVTYYQSYSDAISNNNQIINDTNFINTSNPQIIYAKVTNAGGCSAITNFNLVLSNPDILFIPDYNLKNMLVNIYSLDYGSIYLGYELPFAKDSNNVVVPIDSNNDGEIQVTEAMNIYDLSIIRYPGNLNIANASGLEVFTNLTKLNLSKYNLSTLNFSGFTNLTELKCWESNIVNLNTDNMPNLITLDCHMNAITSLNLDNNINLVTLQCSYNALTSLNLSYNINLSSVNTNYNQLSLLNLTNITGLQKLYCNYNNLSILNTSLLTNLTELEISHNNLSNVNLTNNVNLVKLNYNNNQLSNLDLSTLINLTSLDCSSNLISTLNFINLINLGRLNCSSNLLTSLNLSLFPSLTGLDCSTNQLTTLNLQEAPNLSSLSCNSNQLIVLDFSPLTSLFSLYCNNNQIRNLDFSNNLLLNDIMFQNNDLRYINLKNGKNDGNIFYSYAPFNGNNPFINNPNLNYICVDEVGEGTLTLYLEQANLNNNTILNSYCSFNPGGNYNTITGITKFDSNNNGCDTNDSPQPNIRVNINDGTTTGASFTNASGNYKFYTQAGSFNITPSIENPTWFNFSPNTATIPFANNNNNVATQDFCITANGIHNDLEIVIAPTTTARPGFNAEYLITYKNKGNQTVSGNLNFNYDDSILDFVSSTFATTTQSTGILNYDFINLQPFESRSIYITLNVNTPTETPAVNIGDILNFSAAINTTLSDEIPSDNLFNYNQTVVGSFDPNDITCIEGESVSTSEIGNYLHYIVNFENTGTFQAENIVVKTTIDPNQFDINSLQLLSASNQVDARITGNVVEFIFDQIMLDTGGHGNVLLKVRSKNNLVTGDIVSKRADIFFDYNAPIDTGFANTTFQSLSNSSFVKDNTISVYPNPANSIVNIKANSNLKSIQLYDVQGRILQTKLVNQSNEVLDISNQSNGIYFLKITSDVGVKVEQIVKE